MVEFASRFVDSWQTVSIYLCALAGPQRPQIAHSPSHRTQCLDSFPSSSAASSSSSSARSPRHHHRPPAPPPPPPPRSDYEGELCGQIGRRDLRDRPFATSSSRTIYRRPSACARARSADERRATTRSVRRATATKRGVLGRRCFAAHRTRAHSLACLPVDPALAATADAWMSRHVLDELAAQTLQASGVIFGAWAAAAAASVACLLLLRWLPHVTLLLLVLGALGLSVALAATLLSRGGAQYADARAPVIGGEAVCSREVAAAQLQGGGLARARAPAPPRPRARAARARDARRRRPRLRRPPSRGAPRPLAAALAFSSPSPPPSRAGLHRRLPRRALARPRAAVGALRHRRLAPGRSPSPSRAPSAAPSPGSHRRRRRRRGVVPRTGARGGRRRPRARRRRPPRSLATPPTPTARRRGGCGGSCGAVGVVALGRALVSSPPLAPPPHRRRGTPLLLPPVHAAPPPHASPPLRARRGASSALRVLGCCCRNVDGGALVQLVQRGPIGEREAEGAPRRNRRMVAGATVDAPPLPSPSRRPRRRRPPPRRAATPRRRSRRAGDAAPPPERLAGLLSAGARCERLYLASPGPRAPRAASSTSSRSASGSSPAAAASAAPSGGRGAAVLHVAVAAVAAVIVAGAYLIAAPRSPSPSGVGRLSSSATARRRSRPPTTARRRVGAADRGVALGGAAARQRARQARRLGPAARAYGTTASPRGLLMGAAARCAQLVVRAGLGTRPSKYPCGGARSARTPSRARRRVLRRPSSRSRAGRSCLRVVDRAVASDATLDAALGTLVRGGARVPRSARVVPTARRAAASASSRGGSARCVRRCRRSATCTSVFCDGSTRAR